MQKKVYNAYRITHKNGSVEDINALDLVQALENMDIQETESKVLQAFLVKENVQTLIEDERTEVLFSAIVENGGGSIATPAQGKIHTGDMIALKAIPDRNYTFVEWKLNGFTISKEPALDFVMPELKGGLDTAVFTATFKMSDIAWSSEALPVEATTNGCLAFPLQGVAEANENISLIAVEGTGYTFDHWERNGENLGTNKILNVQVTPLAENETACKFTAIFTAN